MVSKERVWRWRVEPGMEDAFEDLLGWLLSSQRDADVETASLSGQRDAEVEPARVSSGWSAFHACCRRVSVLACCPRAA